MPETLGGPNCCSLPEDPLLRKEKLWNLKILAFTSIVMAVSVAALIAALFVTRDWSCEDDLISISILDTPINPSMKTPPAESCLPFFHKPTVSQRPSTGRSSSH